MEEEEEEEKVEACTLGPSLLISFCHFLFSLLGVVHADSGHLFEHSAFETGQGFLSHMQIAKTVCK